MAAKEILIKKLTRSLRIERLEVWERFTGK